MTAIFRGAPFDAGNLWERPAVDGGRLVYAQTGTFSNIEGGNFTNPPIKYLNGGLLPKTGTSSYIPIAGYGPDGPLIIEE